MEVHTASYYAFSTKTHEFNMKYMSFGNPKGPPVIFIHGTPWSHRVWLPYAEALAPFYKVHLFDNPGFGVSLAGASISGRHELDASLATQSEAFAYLFRHWNLSQPPHIIAHDVGGLISLRANLLYGCDYASLCLVDVVALRPFGSSFFKLVGSHPDIFNAIPDPIAEGMVRSYIQGAAFKPLAKEVEDLLTLPWTKKGMQCKGGFLRQIRHADQRHVAEVESRYGEVGNKMPVKIIWGKEDSWIPVDRASKLAGMIGTDQVVIVEEAGHLIQYDQPIRLGVELANWLARVAQG